MISAPQSGRKSSGCGRPGGWRCAPNEDAQSAFMFANVCAPRSEVKNFATTFVALAVTSVFESVALFGVGWMLLCLCAVRAGQSRSWRARLTGDVPTGSFSLPR